MDQSTVFVVGYDVDDDTGNFTWYPTRKEALHSIFPRVHNGEECDCTPTCIQKCQYFPLTITGFTVGIPFGKCYESQGEHYWNLDEVRKAISDLETPIKPARD